MSIADWKEQEKEQRRQYIMDAAEKLFFSRGYDNVTMDDIAKEVGLTKKSLYLYFKNKEALFFVVVLRGTRILNALVKEYTKRGRTGFDGLWEIGHAYYSFASKYPDYDRACNYFYSGRFDVEHILKLKNEDPIMAFNVSGYDFWKEVDMASIKNWEIVKEIVETRHGSLPSCVTRLKRASTREPLGAISSRRKPPRCSRSCWKAGRTCGQILSYCWKAMGSTSGNSPGTSATSYAICSLIVSIFGKQGPKVTHLTYPMRLIAILF